MVEDTEGFLYPVIDSARCTRCGACEKTCQVIHPFIHASAPPTHVRAAWSSDVSVRAASSSGGLFAMLASEILARGGSVFGASFDETLHLRHRAACTSEEAASLRGSKYLQSAIGNAYEEARARLRNSQWVLFAGTPCQISGLRLFLGHPYERLVAVDLVCHGVPSPEVFREYVQGLEASHRSRVVDYRFRDKPRGWNQFEVSARFASGDEYRRVFHEDVFMAGFLQNLYLRPACHCCAYARISRVGDVTLGDFWGVAHADRALDDDRGTTLLIVNTDAGKALADAVLPYCRSAVLPLDAAIRGNPCLVRPVRPSPYRRNFFESTETGGFEMRTRAILRRQFRLSARLSRGARRLASGIVRRLRRSR